MNGIINYLTVAEIVPERGPRVVYSSIHPSVAKLIPTYLELVSTVQRGHEGIDVHDAHPSEFCLRREPHTVCKIRLKVVMSSEAWKFLQKRLLFTKDIAFLRGSSQLSQHTLVSALMHACTERSFSAWSRSGLTWAS